MKGTMAPPSWENYELIQQHPQMTCEHKSIKCDRLVTWAPNQTDDINKKRKEKSYSTAYPPDKIWLRQKSPSSFESKLQSRRTISRPLHSITCSRIYYLCIPKERVKPKLEVFENFCCTSYFFSFLVNSFTAAYFFFLRSSILLYKPSRSISRHLYFLLT